MPWTLVFSVSCCRGPKRRGEDTLPRAPGADHSLFSRAPTLTPEDTSDMPACPCPEFPAACHLVPLRLESCGDSDAVASSPPVNPTQGLTAVLLPALIPEPLPVRCQQQLLRTQGIFSVSILSLPTVKKELIETIYLPIQL